MKDRFIIDSFFQNNNESYLERFLNYKFQKEIDIDVCKENILTYIRNNGIFKDKEAQMVLQPGSSCKYQIVSGNTIYRGETLINCMQLLLQIVNADADELYTKDDIRDNRSIILDNEFYKNHTDLINDFVKSCYSPGNFCAIPFASKEYSLNVAKGRLKQSGHNYTFRDSVDTYFNVLNEYFSNNQVRVSLVKYIDNRDEYRLWKERYKKKNGIELYISDNTFAPFFDGVVPKVLWKKTDDWRNDVIEYINKAKAAIDTRTNLLE